MILEGKKDISTMMFDLVVIGGGVVGLAVCRSAALKGYNVALVEREADLLFWASGSNSGIVCTGVDAAEGSLERALIRDSISQLRSFYRSMDLPMRPCGSLVCQWSWDEDDNALENVLMDSHNAGDTHAERWTAAQLSEKEPLLNKADCKGAVWIPGEIVVDPFLHGVALAAHARQNKAKIFTNFEVANAIFDESSEFGWTIERKTNPGDSSGIPERLRAKVVVNTSGLWADELQTNVFGTPPVFVSKPRRGQYLVINPASPEGDLDCPIQPIPTHRTKGIFIFSTLYNQIVVGPTADEQESKIDRAVDLQTREFLIAHVRRILPNLPITDETIIGEYVGLRPATNHRDYQIEVNAHRRSLVCAGIRSTGLTASLGIGRHALHLLEASGLLLPPNAQTIKTRPLPSVGRLAQQFRETGRVTIDGHSYAVTHPLTRIGFLEGLGLANPS